MHNHVTVIGCLHDPANVQHYICWKFAGSCKNPINHRQYFNHADNNREPCRLFMSAISYSLLFYARNEQINEKNSDQAAEVISR